MDRTSVRGSGPRVLQWGVGPPIVSKVAVLSRTEYRAGSLASGTPTSRWDGRRNRPRARSPCRSPGSRPRIVPAGDAGIGEVVDPAARGPPDAGCRSRGSSSRSACRSGPRRRRSPIGCASAAASSTRSRGDRCRRPRRTDDQGDSCRVATFRLAGELRSTVGGDRTGGGRRIDRPAAVLSKTKSVDTLTIPAGVRAGRGEKTRPSPLTRSRAPLRLRPIDRGVRRRVHDNLGLPRQHPPDRRAVGDVGRRGRFEGRPEPGPRRRGRTRAVRHRL